MSPISWVRRVTYVSGQDTRIPAEGVAAEGGNPTFTNGGYWREGKN